MANLTAILLTKNEEKNIETCIRSLGALPERICVIDSGSEDATKAIARALGAEVIEHPFYDYATQFNWALDNVGVRTKWVLRVDADEYYTAVLIEELEALCKAHENDDVNGVITESNFYFMGRRIDHGGSKKRKIVAFKYGHGFIEKRRMDEHTILTDGRAVEAKHRFDHRDFKDLGAWIDKLNAYADREADDYFIEKERYARGEVDLSGVGDEKLMQTRRRKFKLYYRFPKFLRCQLLFLYQYIFRLGFLDGKEGFIYHWMYQRWYRTLVDAKILEREKEASRGER